METWALEDFGFTSIFAFFLSLSGLERVSGRTI